eukprot:scaffold164853_cov19-Tisochrysis_lutea.AAC.1
MDICWLKLEWSACGLQKTLDWAAPRPQTKQGHPETYDDGCCVNWSWNVCSKLCPLHPRSPKLGSLSNSFCLPNLLSFSLDCRLAGSGQGMPAKVAKRFLQPLPPMHPDTAGLPRTFV